MPFKLCSEGALQCSGADGCRDGAASLGHAEFPPCSTPHPCFPSTTKDTVTSALSIKADNQLLSKIRIERKPNPRFHPLLHHLHKPGERRPGLHLSLYYLHALEQRAAEVTAQREQELSGSWRGGRVTGRPRRTPSCSLNMTRANPAPHVTACNTRSGGSPTSCEEGTGTWSFAIIRPGWHIMGNMWIRPRERRSAGRGQGQAEAGCADRSEPRSADQRT